MNKLSIKHLSVFVQVYKENSITRAAGMLGMSQPQVSLCISDIEKYYGIPLFERAGRGINHTQAATQLFEYASHIISMYSEMDAKMRGWNAAGRLRVGSSISIGAWLMPSYIKKYKSLYPDIDICVTIDSSDIIERMLLESRLDFALIEGTPHSENLIIEPFMEDDLILICNPSHPLAQKSPGECVTIEEIWDEPLLLREPNSATRNLAEEVLVRHGMPVNPVWESTSTTAIINAVIENLGISILPRRFLTNYINSGAIVPLKLEDVDFKRTYNIVYHKNKYFTRSVIAFFDIIEARNENKN